MEVLEDEHERVRSASASKNGARPRTLSRRSPAELVLGAKPDAAGGDAARPIAPRRHRRQRGRRHGGASPAIVASSARRMPAWAFAISASAQKLDAIAVRAANGPPSSVASPSSRQANSRTRRLLPIPGAPRSVTSCGGALRRRASASRRSEHPHCPPDERRSRCAGRPRSRGAAATAHAGTGSAFPFARTGSTSPILDRCPASHGTSPHPTRMPSTGAADWSRAQVLTTSPAAILSPASASRWSVTAPRRC